MTPKRRTKFISLTVSGVRCISSFIFICHERKILKESQELVNKESLLVYSQFMMNILLMNGRNVLAFGSMSSS